MPRRVPTPWAVPLLVVTATGSFASPPANAEGAALADRRWIARNQQEDGSWGNPAGTQDERVRLTGMALLNLLNAGYTHLSRDRHDGIVIGQTVKSGIQYLMRGQNAGGRLTSADDALDAHLWSAMALVEAYGLTGSGLFKEEAGKSVAWLERVLRPGRGWGSVEHDDPELTLHAAILLRSAEISDLPYPEILSQEAKSALDRLDARDRRSAFEPTATAMLLVANSYWKRSSKARGHRAERVARALPASLGRDARFTYWGAYALYLHDQRGALWKRWQNVWNPRMLELQHQGPDRNRHGSWDPPAREIKQATAPVPPTPAFRRRVEALISRLNDDQWTERERATEELSRIDRRALPLLREAFERLEPEAVVRVRIAMDVLEGLCTDPARIEMTALHGLILTQCYYHYPPLFMAR
jgi:hypothetical protein